MKICYRKGDVTDAHERVIAHGCNAQGVMGSGVAGALRRKYPEVFKGYRQWYDANGLELGSIVYTHIKPAIIKDDDGAEITLYTQTVANMITQKFFGGDGRVYVDYSAIHEAFINLNRMSRVFLVMAYPAIAMPRIGAGLGGGDWAVISSIIEETSINYQPVVYDLE